MCRCADWPRLFLAAALFASFAAPAFAQHPEIEKPAAELAQSLFVKYGHQFGKTRVVVIPFTRLHGYDNELGTALADELAQSLSKQGKNLDVIDSKELVKLGKQEGFYLEEWSDGPTIRRLAAKLGAYLAVFGTLESSGAFVYLRLRVVRVADGEEIAAAGRRLPKTSELEKLLAASPKDFFPLSAQVAAEPPLPAGVLRPGRNGVNYPECAYCPDPRFTDEGRAAKYNGSVLLSLTVNPNGSASDIYLIKAAPFGLTRQAIEAVKAWRFKPAKDRDGNPVAVRVQIEVTFRILSSP
ncbi:MAG: TonB family protein [Acidobacteria bacterium]|nr:TonB family protein [Acidobacteriota bacterium]MCL5287556.1 TonB family protein [Acidobacteriota bacterium]